MILLFFFLVLSKFLLDDLCVKSKFSYSSPRNSLWVGIDVQVSPLHWHRLTREHSSHTDVYFAQPSVPSETQKRSQKMNSHSNSRSAYTDKHLGSQQNKAVGFHIGSENITLYRQLTKSGPQSEGCGILGR